MSTERTENSQNHNLEGSAPAAATAAEEELKKAQEQIKELERKSNLGTLEVVDYDRKIHSGLPKGTILGVLES